MSSAVQRRISRGRRSVRRAVLMITSPQPTVDIELRAWVPSWLLRVVLSALGVGTMITLGPPGPLVLIMVGFLIAVLVRPGARTGSLFCLVIAIIWLVFPDAALSPETSVLLAVLPAVPALGSAIEPLPWNARIEWAALRPAGVRYLVIQLISQPLVLAAAALQEQGLSLLPLAIAGAVAVALAVWLLLPRLSR